MSDHRGHVVHSSLPGLGDHMHMPAMHVITMTKEIEVGRLVGQHVKVLEHGIHILVVLLQMDGLIDWQADRQCLSAVLCCDMT